MASFVGESRTLKERRRTELDSVGKKNVRRPSVQRRGRLARQRRLREFELVVASPLVAELIYDRSRERRRQAQVDRVNVNEVIAEAGATARVRRLRLYACGRCPAQAVVCSRESV